MNISKFLVIILFMVTGLTLYSCDDNTGPIVCTDQFEIITLNVQNSEGMPAEDVAITVIDSRTEEPINVCEELECNFVNENGDYVVFHDGFFEDISMEGRLFEVNGEKDDASFTDNFVFAKDQCHVLKKSGPDTVIID